MKMRKLMAVAAVAASAMAPSQSFAENEPDAYIEYVQSDGKQYINTGVCPNANMTIDADVDLMGNGIFMGVSHYESYPIECTGGYIAGRLLRSGYATSGVAVNTGRHRVVASGTGTGNNFTISVDGSAVVNSTGNVSVESAGATMWVFQGQYAGNTTCTAKLYGLNISTNGVMARQFVPGIKDGVAGLYDRQNDVWYVSQSSTALIAGPVFAPTSPTPTEFPTSQQTVTLECATAGATIYYTTDGSDPTTSSAVYSAPFAVTGGTTVKARAYRTGLPESAIFSATFTHEVSLTHRWSFTNDYSDSVGGSTGTPIGSALAIENGEVVMSGDGYGTGSLNLGNGVMPGADATIEIWATRTGVTKWARIFDIGSSTSGYFTMSWVDDTDGSKDQVILRKDNSSDATANTMTYANDVKYYISVTFKANDNGSTTVSWARRSVETGALEKSGSKTYSGWTLAAIAAGNFYLGHSQWSDNFDANAKYDEVRIWNGVVGDDQLAANAAMGPDVYTSGPEDGFTLADNAVFNVPADGYAASGNVTLGAGSKLRFDTSSMQYDDAVSFSATGFNVPSGSILDYVEPQGSANFGVTLSGNTITVTRLRQNKPDAYLEYVESDGRQWIDTGVIPGPTGSTTPAVTNMVVDADLDWISGNRMVSSTWNDFHPLINRSGKIGATFKNTSVDSAKSLDSGRHRVVTTAKQGNRLTIDVDGVTTTSGANVSAQGSARTLYVFGSNNGGSAVDMSTAKLYGMKIYINGVLERDFVPGIKNYVAGLYDMLNDKWYVSQSGELIPGPVKERHNEPQVYLDYVKSTGAQWVETNFKPSRTMTVEADLDWESGVVLSQNNYDIRVLSPNNNCIAGSTYSYSSYATTDVPLNSGRHHVVVKSVDGQKLKVSVDGAAPAEAGSASSRSCTPDSLFIFAAHSGSGTGYSDAAKAKLYGLKMYDSNGILKRDFVPGIKDNVVGLYDMVSDKFYSSGTSTPLVAGPAVERSKPDAFVEYVESNGSQWVDTGVDGRAGVKAEADIDWVNGYSPLGVMGNDHCLLLQSAAGDIKVGGQARGSGQAVTDTLLNSGRHLIVSDVGNGSKMTITVDGTDSATSSGNASGSTGLTIWMFAAHHYNGGKWGEGRSKFYGLKLWQTGSDGVCRLQRHFIPCVKGGRAGLYDAVSGVIFYSHSGTDLTASSTEVPLAVWRNESDDASLATAANWCGDLQNATDAVVCAPWLPAVSSESGLAVSNLTVTGGNLAFADGTNTVAGTLSADGALAFTNLVVNGSADCAVAVSGSISGHGAVNSLTLAEGARFVPDGAGYLTIADALDGTMLIDMTDIDLSGVKGRFPLFKTGTENILPVASSVEFVGGRPPAGRKLIRAKSGFGYDLDVAGFVIFVR